MTLGQNLSCRIVHWFVHTTFSFSDMHIPFCVKIKSGWGKCVRNFSTFLSIGSTVQLQKKVTNFGKMMAHLLSAFKSVRQDCFVVHNTTYTSIYAAYKFQNPTDFPNFATSDIGTTSGASFCLKKVCWNSTVLHTVSLADMYQLTPKVLE